MVKWTISLPAVSRLPLGLLEVTRLLTNRNLGIFPLNSNILLHETSMAYRASIDPDD